MHIPPVNQTNLQFNLLLSIDFHSLGFNKEHSKQTKH